MNYRSQWDDRGETGRYDTRAGQRWEGEQGGSGREPWDERGAERGSYASRHGFRGDPEMDPRGRGDWRGDWRSDFRGPRGGWDSGRVSMDPRGEWRGQESESAGWGSRGEWTNPRNESVRGPNWGDGGYGPAYGGGSSFSGALGGPSGASYGGSFGGGSGSGQGGGHGISYGSRRESGRFDAGRGDWSRGDWNEGRDEPRSWSGEGARGGDWGGQRETDWQRGGRGSSYSTSPYNERGPGWSGGMGGGGGMGWTGRGGEASSHERMMYGTEAERGRYSGRGPKNYRRNDERIKEDVCERLKASPDIDASDVEIEIKEGIITLTGEVGSRREKRAAEDALESISGVEDVTNQLKVRSSDKRREGGNGSGRSESDRSTSMAGSSSGASGSSSLGSQSQQKQKGKSFGSSNES